MKKFEKTRLLNSSILQTTTTKKINSRYDCNTYKTIYWFCCSLGPCIPVSVIVTTFSPPLRPLLDVAICLIPRNVSICARLNHFHLAWCRKPQYLFFLSGFSLTKIHESQGCWGRERAFI